MDAVIKPIKIRKSSSPRPSTNGNGKMTTNAEAPASTAPAGPTAPEPASSAPSGSPEPAKPQPTPAKKAYSVLYAPNARLPLPDWIAEPLADLQKQLDMQLWLFIQMGGADPVQQISYEVYKHFFEMEGEIVRGSNVALLIESPGGSAHDAFKIARLFQRRTAQFVTIVPCYAKSAATLLALGGHELILGHDAELGPLDVQLLDPDREKVGSALDAVQALERLNAFSLTAIDQAMKMLLLRTGKRIDTLLPVVMTYAASLVHPLLKNIDSEDYTRKSRNLKIAEEYAGRLISKSAVPNETAVKIARKLVENYPTHSFVIDPDEARTIGIQVSKRNLDLSKVTKLVYRLRDAGAPLIGLFSEKGA